MRRQPYEVKVHLDKARESALLAVETYNRPGTTFRSGGYIVLMCIAWTSLFHAVFFKRKIKPFYRKKEHRGHFDIVDGDKRAWELSTCADNYWKADNPPERANLNFFVKLRNKIEHRSMPALDIDIFGECQALLFNFEELLIKEFGNEYALNESLSLALQFSCLRNEKQEKAVRRLHKSISANITSYINRFRSGLSAELLKDLRFSYKVFLIPQLANHASSSDLAVQFVKYDPSKPEEMARYEQIVSLIKPAAGAVIKPGRVVGAGVTEAIPIRIVNQSDSVPYCRISFDDTHPHNQKKLLAAVNDKLISGININTSICGLYAPCMR